MEAYRTYVTITDPQQVVLNNVPFRPGQRVEILILSRASDEAALAEDLRALLRDTQSLPNVKRLSEADIIAEVAAYRNSR